MTAISRFFAVAAVALLGWTGTATLANAQLARGLKTADGDVITVHPSPGSETGGTVLCLKTRRGMWKKELRFDDGSMLRSEKGTRDCMEVDAPFVRFEIVKAKVLGVMTGVGSGSLDLAGWEGNTITIVWRRD
jgi:hypothetical protein